jgi:AraC-like DNA-binding protein
MFPLRQEMGFARVGRCADIVDLWRSGFRARVVCSHDLVYDDALVGPVPDSSVRRRVVVVLDGRARVRGAERAAELGPGAFRLAPQRDASSMRSEGRRFWLVAFDWHEELLGTGGPTGDGRLDPVDVARLTVFADAIHEAWRDANAACAAIAEVWRVLHAAGVVTERLDAEALRETVPARMTRLSSALCDVGTRLEANPMLVDMERRLDLSRRQVARSFQEMASTYGVDYASWREMANLCRLRTAAALMTHPQARTAEVARAVGYSSVEALCHAFARAGLPSPGRIMERLDALSCDSASPVDIDVPDEQSMSPRISRRSPRA